MKIAEQQIKSKPMDNSKLEFAKAQLAEAMKDSKEEFLRRRAEINPFDDQAIHDAFNSVLNNANTPSQMPLTSIPSSTNLNPSNGNWGYTTPYTTGPYTVPPSIPPQLLPQYDTGYIITTDPLDKLIEMLFTNVEKIDVVENTLGYKRSDPYHDFIFTKEGVTLTLDHIFKEYFTNKFKNIILNKQVLKLKLNTDEKESN